jgi:hypothetical protein
VDRAFQISKELLLFRAKITIDGETEIPETAQRLALQTLLGAKVLPLRTAGRVFSIA